MPLLSFCAKSMMLAPKCIFLNEEQAAGKKAKVNILLSGQLLAQHFVYSEFSVHFVNLKGK